MTVKCLNETVKTYIAHAYVHENASTDELARFNNVSPRTINRVLVEQGVARTPNRKPRTEQSAASVTPVEQIAPVAPAPSKEVWVQQPLNLDKPSLIDNIKGFFQNILAITKKHVQLTR